MQGGRRQHGHRGAGKIRMVLARPDDEKRLCGDDGANMGTDSPGKSGPCWRDMTEDKGFAERTAPTSSYPSLEGGSKMICEKCENAKRSQN